VEENYETIRELARRGIMSSVCSKNDHETVKRILQEKEIWDYLIFPSIDWSPKGSRIASIVEAVQLRAPTVLFIDDNPGNRAEARAIVPGIEVADESIVPTLLSSSRCYGKPDRELSRLTQYKLLEKRKANEATAGGSNVEFLRASNIRVCIEHDVSSQIDRAIELINRTNQLNFTKRRLPEKIEEARRQLRDEISHFRIQAGLVSVVDNYGDYGFCGFFRLGSYHNGAFLHDFCFSCRTIGMGIEKFVYELIGRPRLAIAGEVLSDPVNDPPVDWIRVVDARSMQLPQSHRDDETLPAFFLRGGCDLVNIGFYAGLTTPAVVGEYDIVRDGMALRLDHSMCGRYCLEGVPSQAMAAFKMLGFNEEDFRSEVLQRRARCICDELRTGCLVAAISPPENWRLDTGVRQAASGHR
jgi:FkbH-like protein